MSRRSQAIGEENWGSKPGTTEAQRHGEEGRQSGKRPVVLFPAGDSAEHGPAFEDALVSGADVSEVGGDQQGRLKDLTGNPPCGLALEFFITNLRSGMGKWLIW